MTTETAVKEKPVLFSGPMVRAILDGRKTVTRRVIKPQPGNHPHGDPDEFGYFCVDGEWWSVDEAWEDRGPFLPGTRLWVKETFGILLPDGSVCRGQLDLNRIDYGDALRVRYRADNDAPCDMLWRPSIFMPRWASRITLEITAVRAERLQVITADDAKAEGAECRTDLSWAGGTDPEFYPQGFYGEGYIAGFREFWDSLSPEGSRWSDNPWVWAYSFRKVEAANA